MEFIEGIESVLTGNETAIAVAAQIIEIPFSLLTFLRTDGKALMDLGDQLEVYVSALESARSTDSVLHEIAQTLGRLRVAHRSATPDAAQPVRRSGR